MGRYELKELIPDIVQVYGGAHGRTMIFTETKKDCNELCLSEAMKQGVQQLHGDISQKQRELTLQGFRDGRFRCGDVTQRYGSSSSAPILIPRLKDGRACGSNLPLHAHTHESESESESEREGERARERDWRLRI